MNEQHIDSLILRNPPLESCRASILDAAQALISSFTYGSKLLVAGNGGSAADADHISGELLKGFASERALGPEDRQRLGEDIASHLQGGLPVLPLSQFTALLTAFANDCDGSFGYAQLVWALATDGDVLMAISTSGNSKNIINACRVARGKDVTVIGLTGASGQLKDLADIAVCAPSTTTHVIQEYHLPIYHALCLTIEDELFPMQSQMVLPLAAEQRK